MATALRARGLLLQRGRLLRQVRTLDPRPKQDRNFSSPFARARGNTDSRRTMATAKSAAAAAAGAASGVVVDLEGQERAFGPWKIASGEIFCESASSFAFVNLKPVVSGHVLVAPKRVCKRFTQLSMEEVADLWQLAKVVGKELEANAQDLFADRKKGMCSCPCV